MYTMMIITSRLNKINFNEISTPEDIRNLLNLCFLFQIEYDERVFRKNCEWAIMASPCHAVAVRFVPESTQPETEFRMSFAFASSSSGIHTILQMVNSLSLKKKTFYICVYVFILQYVILKLFIRMFRTFARLQSMCTPSSSSDFDETWWNIHIQRILLSTISVHEKFLINCNLAPVYSLKF